MSTLQEAYWATLCCFAAIGLTVSARWFYRAMTVLLLYWRGRLVRRWHRTNLLLAAREKRGPIAIDEAVILLPGMDVGILLQGVLLSREDRTLSVARLIAPRPLLQQFHNRHGDTSRLQDLVIETLAGDIQLNRFLITSVGVSCTAKEFVITEDLHAQFHDAVELRREAHSTGV